VRVFNLTDIPTSALEQRGLVNCQLAVGNRMICPGEFVDVEDTPSLRARLRSVVELGALALDRLPAKYVSQRQQAMQAAVPVPMRHLEVCETLTAAMEKPAIAPVVSKVPDVVVQRSVLPEIPPEDLVGVPGADPAPLATGKSKKKGRR
jgi:hypothetical protein